MIPITSFSQANVQWKASVNVGWEGNTNPRADWLFDVIPTADGNYFAVGFAREDETGSDEHLDVPAYCLMGGNGRLIRDGVLAGNDTPGRLFTVTEADNGDYYAGGNYILNGTKTGLLVRIDRTTLEAIYIPVSPAGAYRSRIRSIVNLTYGPNNSLHHLLIAGRTKLVDDDDDFQRWMAIYDYDGNLISDITPAISSNVLDEQVESINYEIKPNGDLLIYTATIATIQKEGSFARNSFRRNDSDILIESITYNVVAQTFATTGTKALHNSITQTPRDFLHNAQVFSNDIFSTYPPDDFFDKYPYGPKYLSSPSVPNHVNFDRQFDAGGSLFDNWNETAPLNGYYIEDWSNGSEDRPYSLIITDNYIVVSALLNRFVLWPMSNEVLGNAVLLDNTEEGKEDINEGLYTNSSNSCVDFGGHYQWGEAYVLFLDKTNLSLQKATHLGTWSGGDFNPAMIQTSDGGFAIAGSTSGCPQDLPAVGHGEDGIFAKLDALGEVEYRKTASGPNGVSFCAFNLAETLDGGIIMVGNTEDEGGVEHEENYCFVKFGTGCGYDNASIASTTGNQYIVGIDETWDSDQTVNTQVIIPSGHKLSIEGTGNQHLTIQFADSREVYDLGGNSGVGITVQAGGQLDISYATLTGWSCNGQGKMWDGISVEGVESEEQTAALQGTCNLVVATIQDARIGVAATSTWWATAVVNNQNTYNPTGSNSNIEVSSFKHGGNGGGKVDAFYSNFVNNRRGVIFMKYLPHNKSRFRNCNFISDGPLVDPTQRRKPAESLDFHTLPLGTATHLSAWATNVNVQFCNFSGAASIIPDFRPIGIGSADASLLVNGGNMQTLKVGIEGASITGGITANLSASTITFDNVVQGINLRATAADWIRNCTFNNIPANTTLSGIEPTGIFGVFNSAGLIENNHFIGTNTAQETFGLVIRETGSQGIEIKENEFTNTRYGNQFEGNNLALVASCNQYTSMGFSGWNCLPLGGQGILGDQGSGATQGNKADNQFFDACTTADGDKHIYATFAFNYYDKMGNPNPAMADCVSDVVNFQTSNEFTSINCQITEPPCNPYPCDHISIFLQTDKNIKARNKALRGLIHTGVDVNDEKLPILYDDAMFILRDRAMEEDQQLLVGTLTALEKTSEAQTEITNLATISTTNVSYVDYLTTLTGAGLDITGLTIFATNNTTANTTFLNEYTATKAMANNAKWLTKGAYTPLIALTSTNGGNKSFTSLSNTTEGKPNIGKVFPNPFSNKVTFDLQILNNDIIYQIEVVNILGKQVWQQKVKGGRRISWNTNKQSTGTYFYTIRSGNETIMSGKIIKLDK